MILAWRMSHYNFLTPTFYFKKTNYTGKSFSKVINFYANSNWVFWYVIKKHNTLLNFQYFLCRGNSYLLQKCKIISCEKCVVLAVGCHCVRRNVRHTAKQTTTPQPMRRHSYRLCKSELKFTCHIKTYRQCMKPKTSWNTRICKKALIKLEDYVYSNFKF